MTIRRILLTGLGGALGLGLYVGTLTAAPAPQSPAAALSLHSGRVSISGTSNIHPYTASTTQVRLVRLQLAAGIAAAEMWDALVKPAGLEAFEIAIPAATLSSPKEGLDKNMHKALKVTEHPEITFRLSKVEAGDAPGALRATGVLKIAGAERTVTLPLKVVRNTGSLTITGELPLLMTDFGITPPKAMLGMLKTDPKVTVAFETVLGVPLT